MTRPPPDQVPPVWGSGVEGFRSFVSGYNALGSRGLVFQGFSHFLVRGSKLGCIVQALRVLGLRCSATLTRPRPDRVPRLWSLSVYVLWVQEFRGMGLGSFVGMDTWMCVWPWVCGCLRNLFKVSRYQCCIATLNLDKVSRFQGWF